MCGLGLIYSKRGRHTGRRMFELYEKQKTRGQQGFGFIAIKDNKIKSLHRSLYEHGIKKALMEVDADIILFHHRFPTSTKNTLGTTHPIFVAHDELKYDYYIAHNGVINNAHMLKLDHEKLGYKYRTQFKEKTFAVYEDGRQEEMTSMVPVFNDSESLAIELARYIEGKDEKVKTTGAAAFIGIAVEKNSNKVHSIFFGKNKGRDLCVAENNKWYIVSSETGEDLMDMKLWTNVLEDDSWLEQDLAIDVAQPVQRVIYHGRHDDDEHYRYAAGYKDKEDDKEDKKNLDIFAYSDLKNALYTRTERDESGVPPSEFFTKIIAGEWFYVPSKFMADEIKSRPLFSELKRKEESEKTPIVDTKQMDRLEELCMKYSEISQRIDILDSNWSGGFSDEDPTQQIEKLKIEQADVEDQISSLGIDSDIVDEILDLSEQLVSSSSVENKSGVQSPYLNDIKLLG